MKILFVVPSFRNGGTITCLRNIVSMIRREDLHFFVFAITDSGPNKPFLSHYCTLLNPLGDSSAVNGKKSIISKLAQFVKGIKKSLEKIGVDISPLVFKRVAKSLQQQHFDLVIAFQEETATHFCSYFDKTRKIAWIHCDYSRYLSSDKVIAKNLKTYSVYEKIVCVSNYTCSQFLALIPELACKTIPLHNLINDNLIIESSKEPVALPWDRKDFSIVSFGRYDPVKRFEYIPQIAAEIKNKIDVHFKWVIFGAGNQAVKEEIERNIIHYGVEDCVVLFGETNTPYPYLVNARLSVCLSTTEACPNVINEAKILHVPVVATDFGSVNEFLEDHTNGIIAPIDQLGSAIAELIVNEELYNSLKKNISSFKYDNGAIIRELENGIFK